MGVMQCFQSISPDAPDIIKGDFNCKSMNKSLSDFFQYLTCPMRHGKVLDICYRTIRGANKSYCKAPLGTLDHNTVHAVPVCREKKQRGRMWNEDSIQEPYQCFECSNWDIFKETCEDLNELSGHSSQNVFNRF